MIAVGAGLSVHFGWKGGLSLDAPFPMSRAIDPILTSVTHWHFKTVDEQNACVHGKERSGGFFLTYRRRGDL